MKQIQLTRGLFAAVDDRLFDELNRFKWYALKGKSTFYVVRSSPRVNGKQSKIKMHREVFRLMGLPVPVTVDHRDWNGLNNQFDNLRPATRQEQQRYHRKQARNTSGFVGVYLHRSDSWCASARDTNGRKKWLGYFDTALEAALARDEFVHKHHGDFAVLNFPEAFERAA